MLNGIVVEIVNSMSLHSKTQRSIVKLMVKNKKNSSVTPSITLHRLIGQFTYLGASARLLLIATLGLAVYAAQVLETVLSGYDMNAAVLGGVQTLFYILGTFFVLEIGYMMVAQAYRLNQTRDKLILYGSEAVIAALYFIPYLVVLPTGYVFLTRFVFLAALAVLSFRLVVGLLYGSVAKK